MQRVALRVAYDGRAFHGSQRQPGVRTVEGDLLAALARVGAIEDAERARFLAASRTDRGVSAAGNVIAFDTSFRRDELCSAANAHLHDAWALASAPAPHGFNPRSSPRRTYAYLQPKSGVRDPPAFAAALARFEGTHDFTNFGRVEPHVNPVRDVQRVAVADRGGHLRVQIEAPSFLWNQVRRMIGAALAVDRGDATLDALDRALARPREAADLGLAPPEPLVLVDVAHDALAWERDPRATGARHLAARLAELELARSVLGELASEVGGGLAGGPTGEVAGEVAGGPAAGP